MRDQAGEFAGILAAFKDVTDLIELRMQAGEITGFAGIIGRDPKMVQIYRQIRDLGGLSLKEAIIETPEGIKACQDYGKVICQKFNN